eukprot:1909885-Prymnesium_polylepis.2
MAGTACEQNRESACTVQVRDGAGGGKDWAELFPALRSSVHATTEDSNAADCRMPASRAAFGRFRL